MNRITICCKCNFAPPINLVSGYCKTCHAAYMRTWRKTHRPSEDQRVKSNSRSYANVYERRGKIKQAPCKICGSAHSEKHHPDYSKPLLVQWLCRPCHLAHHQNVTRVTSRLAFITRPQPRPEEAA